MKYCEHYAVQCRHHTHGVAELTKILPRLCCDVSQAEDGTVGVMLLIIVTLIQVSLTVSLVSGILNISPAKDKNISICSLNVQKY